jgi:Sulfotransferase family
VGSDRYLEVRHEDLVQDPRAHLERICRFLGEEFLPEQLEYFKGFDQQELPYMHRHLWRPPQAGLRNWREGLGPREQRQIEALCAPTLRACGYEVADFGAWETFVARGHCVAELAGRAQRYVLRRGIKPRRSAHPTEAL